jgi:CRP-like cAMP-binding protein
MALGVTVEPLHAVVQGPGSAWRIGQLAFRSELRRNEALQQSLGRYLHATMTQLAGSAACLRFHQIGPRLARWLLMSQDRADSDSFRVTHEFLAFMLGVRRVGITTAGAALQRQGLAHITAATSPYSIVEGSKPRHAVAMKVTARPTPNC